jgi:hypothetical protein
MIATTATMAKWVLICTISNPFTLPRTTTQGAIPNPQECETLASNCWREYYSRTHEAFTQFDTLCKANANHREYFFHYTCDQALRCHRS